MSPTELSSVFGGHTYVGIILAVLSGIALSLGTQYQHRGVEKVDRAYPASAERGLTGAHFRRLLARPSWLFGTLMLGLAILLQLVSLWFAPLTVVQPLGAVALVITTFLNARMTRTRLTAKTLVAVVLCVGGVGLFVTVAAFFARLRPVSSPQLIIVIVALGVLGLVLAIIYAVVRRSPRPLFYVVAAGTLFGFVATLAKVVIGRIQTLIESGWQFGPEEWLTIACLVGLVLATLLGGWFVQTAHMQGPPDLVVAGLTVIDPIVAVLIGALVLGELSGAPPWATVAMLAMGVVAVIGVVLLARQHPHMQDGRYQTGPTASVPKD